MPGARRSLWRSVPQGPSGAGEASRTPAGRPRRTASGAPGGNGVRINPLRPGQGDGVGVPLAPLPRSGEVNPTGRRLQSHGRSEGSSHRGRCPAGSLFCRVRPGRAARCPSGRSTTSPPGTPEGSPGGAHDKPCRGARALRAIPGQFGIVPGECHAYRGAPASAGRAGRAGRPPERCVATACPPKRWRPGPGRFGTVCSGAPVTLLTVQDGQRHGSPVARRSESQCVSSRCRA